MREKKEIFFYRFPAIPATKHTHNHMIHTHITFLFPSHILSFHPPDSDGSRRVLYRVVYLDVHNPLFFISFNSFEGDGHLSCFVRVCRCAGWNSCVLAQSFLSVSMV